MFVISDQNTNQEISYIQEACGYFGLENNFYDISLEGNFDLFAIPPGKESCLAQDFTNKTICILNNEFALTSYLSDEFKAYPLEFLNKNQLIRAISDFNIHFVIFSPLTHNPIGWSIGEA